MNYQRLKPVQSFALDMSVTNVAVGTPTSLGAVTAAPSLVEAYNGGATPILLFVGAKQIPVTIPPGISTLQMCETIGVGTTLNAQSLKTTNSTGFLILNFFG